MARNRPADHPSLSSQREHRHDRRPKQVGGAFLGGSILTNVPDPQFILAALEATIRSQILAEQQRRPQSTDQRLLTAKQAAVYLGRTESAVRQLIHKRVLPVVRFDRVIRIDVRDLDRLIEENRT
jgi:excisionase family DNA binding protein